MCTLRETLVLALLLAACGGGKTQPPTIPSQSSDLGTASGPDSAGGCTPGCGSNQVCSNGSCVALPSSCPCPTGAYCDLSDNTCHPGCDSNDTCGSGNYCDLSSHACKTGCTDDSACKTSMGERCVNHVCGVPCQSDFACGGGTACNMSTCGANGLCVFSKSADGTACPDDGQPCTTDVCQGGQCQHPTAPDGTSCPGPPSTGCFATVCMSGQCLPGTVPEGTACGSGGQRCHGNQCLTPAGTCQPSSTQAGQYQIIAGSFNDLEPNCSCSTSNGSTSLVTLNTDGSSLTWTACSTACDANTAGFTVLCW